MYSLTALLAFAALVAAQAPTIATPASLVQCQPAQLTWTASSTPVFISIIPGGQPSAAPLEDLGSQNGSSLTWIVDIVGGTQVTVQIRDSTGAVAYSAPVTIQTSSDSSCIGGNASSSGAASASASQTGSEPVSSASASASTSEAAATSSVVESSSSVAVSVSSAASSALSTATAPATTSRATSAVASVSRSATATSAATSATTSPNSASSNMQVGFAGLLGLAAAAILA